MSYGTCDWDRASLQRCYLAWRPSASATPISPTTTYLHHLNLQLLSPIGCCSQLPRPQAHTWAPLGPAAELDPLFAIGIVEHAGIRSRDRRLQTHGECNAVPRGARTDKPPECACSQKQDRWVVSFPRRALGFLFAVRVIYCDGDGAMDFSLKLYLHLACEVFASSYSSASLHCSVRRRERVKPRHRLCEEEPETDRQSLSRCSATANGRSVGSARRFDSALVVRPFWPLMRQDGQQHAVVLRATVDFFDSELCHGGGQIYRTGTTKASRRLLHMCEPKGGKPTAHLRVGITTKPRRPAALRHLGNAEPLPENASTFVFSFVRSPLRLRLMLTLNCATSRRFAPKPIVPLCDLPSA